MRQHLRLSLVLASSLAAWSCASGTTEDQPDAGAPGTGGTPAPGTGGAIIGTGGAPTPGTGGRGTGGTPGPGTGGMIAGTGGMVTPGTGGRITGTGGGIPDAGMPMGTGGRAPDAGAPDAGMSTDAGGSYNPCPTNGDPCKVLPLGDSITYGLITVAADKASSDASVNGKDSHGGYRVKLFSDAVTAGKKMTFVGSQMNGPTTVSSMTFPKSHEGWSGYTIAMIQGKAASDLQSGANIILVHAGTNDTYMGDPAGAPARLSTLVDYLTTNFPNALVVVAKIVPYPGQMANVNLINQSIPAMVQSKVTAGKHVVMADLNTGFATSMLSGDGIHPNQAGYDWMGNAWYTAIGPLLH